MAYSSLQRWGHRARIPHYMLDGINLVFVCCLYGIAHSIFVSTDSSFSLPVLTKTSLFLFLIYSVGAAATISITKYGDFIDSLYNERNMGRENGRR